ncbi:MAG: YsnF/AvaK domain-containing protein, partial [Chloroflexi bacterium]|nr:YsnF/AvaK domain-containing protein [Chloroflexota bacterium]
AGVGAITGALVGMGVPKDEAEYYESEVKSGRTLVAVRADGRYDEAQRLLRQHGAYDIETKDAASARAGADLAERRAADLRATGARSAEGGQTVQLREEELQARKQTVQTGEVTVGKDVVSEQRTLEVPVTREEVVVERHPVEHRPSERPIDERSEAIEVPVREEQVSAEKRAVVYEEVEVGKQHVQETQQVSGTVRREEARIDREGDVSVGGGEHAGWEQAMPAYRTRWQQRAGTTGRRWEDVEPSYRYGWDLRNDPRYRDRSWNDVESDAQRDWATSQPNTPWVIARDSVREAWEGTTK